MRWTVLLFACIMLLQARENPFVPVADFSAKEDRETDPVVPHVPDVPADANETQTIDYRHVLFEFTPSAIVIKTEDKLLKHFRMQNPPRIVMDFKSSADFRTRKASLAIYPFQMLRIGVHEDFYRVVVELAEVKRYTETPVPSGYIFELR